MQAIQNYDLTKLNTFGVKAQTKYFVEITKEQDIVELFSLPEFKKGPVFFLGGGSNVLFTKNWDGIVILNKIKGITILEENEDSVLIIAMGGEVWHDLVDFSISHNWWGLENLSYIPGTVGAAPMQNIGAYGVELKDVLEQVEVYDVQNGEKKIFTKDECSFGYRDSIFKNRVKGKYFISAIVLRLSKVENRNIEYRALKDHIEKNNITDLSLRNISDAVIEIRKNKLPNPIVLGNAGSFFKNVFIDEEELRELQQNYPDIPNFREGDQVKIPAGWLIEQCGFKGKVFGNVGMHEKQALVLVNYGGATGVEIQNFAQLVIDSVYKKFGLKLIPEVNFV